MKIYLYLENRIISFKIPKTISGSFSFDEKDDEDSKLINIEEREGKWVIYSTSDVSLIINNEKVADIPLLPNNFYVIERDNKRHLIYTAKSFDDTFAPYTYGKSFNLTIGNANDCNVFYNIPYQNTKAAKISIKNNSIVLERFNVPIYVNNEILKTKEYVVKFGDNINVYGFKIIFLSSFVLLNNPNGNVKLNITDNSIMSYSMPVLNEPKSIEVHDRDLYSRENYFSKAPRIRRIIKTKEMKLTPPPNHQEKEMPMILTVGPMLTMGIASIISFANTISKITSGALEKKEAFPQLITAGAMLVSMLVWPLLSQLFQKLINFRDKVKIERKYNKYLKEKKQELASENTLQKEILIENYLPITECINIIERGNYNFWDKRIDQVDFLDVRLGVGNKEMDAKIGWKEEEFTMDQNELKKEADKIVEEYKYINNVPIGYSFWKNKITALMGNEYKMYGMMENIILQFITFYSYEDIKIVVFTNEENEEKWEYVKYLNHNFTNDRNIRFFATNVEDAKRLGEYLNYEVQNRKNNPLNSKDNNEYKPYYIIISDDYSNIKRLQFIKDLTELDDNIGFSLILLENKMSSLPSKCDNFITLNDASSSILTDSFQDQHKQDFTEEINYNVDMMHLARKISNIPIEFEEGTGSLPTSITFLEMEHVGKVEQLNIMNRWDSNDSTSSLRAEVGVDEEGNLMYLDLHEKYHGPHGLIAGMTGSGKSEFIITYILSMAINYSPDDVSFILIDYKGGGLAFAFENQATGVALPHLAGVITNLDKAEMDRTLVSIDSEIKRRQKVFNDARDKLGESTIDIYKYQNYYKNGELDEAVPHLFIICDEFAELKAQQPDFMDNLISVARIGRSLGVHLILATQKPSGVVNEQIWSNTKFRVCLKVQDASDSKEMLKRPDAASLKETGRFYLQVGFDEYFALGQSGWCGAKYYPSDKIIKQVDKSINFIDDTADYIKSIQAAGNTTQVEAQGEQLSAIMKNIIDVSDKTGKKARRLWLNNIDAKILVDDLVKKYNVTNSDNDIITVIGEYDAPENQEQGIVTYSLKKQGNSIIYGNDEIERENLITTMFYSLFKNYTTKDLLVYIVDYGSETLRMFNNFPQIGGMVFVGEDEKFKNLFKFITEEIANRKKLLVNYGGSLDTYNAKNEKPLPQILLVLNNYDAILETYQMFNDEISPIARDCERYGISIVISCNAPSSVNRRIRTDFDNVYTLHFNSRDDYYIAFNAKCKITPRDIQGRGIINNGGMHEYQTASLIMDDKDINEFLSNLEEEVKAKNMEKAPPIPILPDKVTEEYIEKEISTIDKIPIGIVKESLKVTKFDFSYNYASSIASNKLININSFMDSLLDVLLKINNLSVFFIDSTEMLPSAAKKEYENKKINYINVNFDKALEKLVEFEENENYRNIRFLYIFYGIERFRAKVDSKVFGKLIELVMKNEHSNIIFADAAKSIKTMESEMWYNKIKNNTDGIWVGKGLDTQGYFRLSKVTKEMGLVKHNNYGYVIKDSEAELVKLLEFNEIISDDEE